MALYTRARIAVRRGHRRREDLPRKVETAASDFRRYLTAGYLGTIDRLAGDAMATRRWAVRCRADALRQLAGTFGPPVRRRATRGKASA